MMTVTPTPLSELPADMQARIAEAVAQPKPPAKWLRLGPAEIPSRAWYEWHRARGNDPFKRRTSLPARLRELVIARDGLVCGLCGGEVEPSDVHIDHLVPVSRGGSDLLANLQVAHARCNIQKGNRV